MHEQPIFIGKPNNEEDKAKGLASELKLRESGALPKRNEVEKSEQQKRLVSELSLMLDLVFQKYGIKSEVIDLNRIHFLPEKDFKKYMSTSSTKGVYFSHENEIILNADAPLNDIVWALTHELVHSKSHNKNAVNYNTKAIDDYRSGYEVANRSDMPGHTHFIAFNEAVTDSITLECLKENKAKIAKEFQFNQEQYKELLSNGVGYLANREFLADLINIVSSKLNISKEELYKKIIQGYVSGEMHHLRVIEQALGPGSLRLLAALPSIRGDKYHQMKNLNYGEILKLFKQYLYSEVQAEKDSIALKLLNERERLQYKNHAEKMNGENN